MTVADGAGGSKKSRRGSQIATKIATDVVYKALTGESGRKLEEVVATMESDPGKTQRPVLEELYYLFGNAAKEAVHAIHAEASSASSAYKEFSTTLLITIHKKLDVGHFVGAYWVGDGGTGIYLMGQELNVLGKADSGEYAGQTRFLDTSMLDPQEIMNRIRFKLVKDFTAVIAMTDGITDPWFETDANIENIDKWNELWSNLAPSTESSNPAKALLDWLDFWSAGNHDDRTISILCPMRTEVVSQLSIEEAEK
jgi:serine/threonine protein phosphatase PrpC